MDNKRIGLYPTEFSTQCRISLVLHWLPLSFPFAMTTQHLCRRMKQNTDKTLTVKQNNFVALCPLSAFCLLQTLLCLSSVSFKIPSLGALHVQTHKIMSSFWTHITIFFSAHWHNDCTSSKASSECSGLETYNRYLATLKE